MARAAALRRAARRATLGAALAGGLGAVLAGCGFQPLYGHYRSKTYDASLASIKVAPIPERIGQMLANDLRNSFNPDGIEVQQRYTLQITLTSAYTDLTLRNDGTPSRRQFTAQAHFVLTQIGSKEPPFQGGSQSYYSYDIGEDPFTTVTQDKDALRRAADQLDEDIRNQVTAYFIRPKTAAAAVGG